MIRSLMVRRGWTALVTAATLLLAACGGGSNDGPGTTNLRVLNATSDVPSLDLYLNETKSFSAAVPDTLTATSSAEAATYIVKVTNTGSTTPLLTGSYTLSRDKNYTAVVWGRTGSLRLATLPEDDDVAAISANNGRLRVYNATSETGAIDVYLTQNDEELSTILPTASAVASTALGAYRDLAAGTYRLRVTGAGDNTDLRLDIPGVVVASKEYSTLIVTAGPGSVLVNGAQLVQRGALTPLKNTKARLRVAAGAEANGTIGVSLDGTAFSSNLRSPATGAYTLVDAGDRLVDVRLNGASISSATRSLTAGGDYTLLGFGSDGTGQATLLTDDNRLPATGRFRIRLVNAAASTDPLTLLVDFDPLLRDVAAGTSSIFATDTFKNAARLDVAPASGTDLFSIIGVNLQSQGVYTVFVLGGDTAPIGLLRKDR